MKGFVKQILPRPVWNRLRSGRAWLERVMLRNLVLKQGLILKHFGARELNAYGLNVFSVSDCFSPVPVLLDLEKNIERWFRPSELWGVRYDIKEMEGLLSNLIDKYSDEFRLLAAYEENNKKAYGMGFTPVDAMVAYFMVRELNPKTYIEVGSGLSTYYCSLAARRNALNGNSAKITCIDPYPYEALYTIPDINIVKKEVQDMDVSTFTQLNAGDILLIDSTHVLKIDGDVPYLYLEILPRLKKGVIIHMHDVPFPYNVPYPPKTWIFERRWPYLWNEAMVVQAFLCYNDAYKIILSTPLIRHFDEDFLRNRIPEYAELSRGPMSTFSSIWVEKVK